MADMSSSSPLSSPSSSKRQLDSASASEPKRTKQTNRVVAYHIHCDDGTDTSYFQPAIMQDHVVESDVATAFREWIGGALPEETRRLSLGNSGSGQWTIMYIKDANVPNKKLDALVGHAFGTHSIGGPVSIYRCSPFADERSGERQVQVLPRFAVDENATMPASQLASFKEAFCAKLCSGAPAPVAAYFVPPDADAELVAFRAHGACVADVCDAFVEWAPSVRKHVDFLEAAPDVHVICDEDGALNGSKPNENLAARKFPMKLHGPVCIYKPIPCTHDELVQGLPEPTDKDGLQKLFSFVVGRRRTVTLDFSKEPAEVLSDVYEPGYVI